MEALDSQTKDPFTTVAEIYLLDSKGNKLPREEWKVLYADSEELSGNDGSASNVFDLQATTFWHTQWEGGQPPHPHFLVIDLVHPVTVSGLMYLLRQDSRNGRIKSFNLYFSMQKIN